MSIKNNRLGAILSGQGWAEVKKDPPPIDFDEKLWHAVVDRVTVYHDDRLVYSLNDGTEITIGLWKIKEKSPNSTVVDAVRGFFRGYSYFCVEKKAELW